MSLINKIYYLLLLTSFLLVNCSSIHHSYYSNQDGKYDSISAKFFVEELFNESESIDRVYLGFGQVFNFRQGPGARAFDIIFEKILFSVSDSTLIIKGYLKDVFNNNSINHVQIVFVRLNKDIMYLDDPKYIEYGNYILSEEGKFDVEFNIFNAELKIIFGERPNYDENGNYCGAAINSMYVYDVFKLLK
jgi:hypothetical protein